MALLFLAVPAHIAEAAGNFKIGVMIGVGLVVLVLYPAFLRNHERRLAALEGRIHEAPQRVPPP